MDFAYHTVQDLKSPPFPKPILRPNLREMKHWYKALYAPIPLPVCKPPVEATTNAYQGRC